jgi:hypothetical protein
MTQADKLAKLREIARVDLRDALPLGDMVSSELMVFNGSLQPASSSCLR